MRTLAGPSAAVEFTHLSRAAGASLEHSFSGPTHSTATGGGDLASAACHQIGVLELMRARGVPLDAVCLLDPKAPTELAPEDGERLSWFLFGVRIYLSPLISPLLCSFEIGGLMGVL